MGSEGPSPVTVHVTGFKKFHGVSENPTQTIVRNLKEYMEKRGMPKGLILGSCSILESAGQGAIVPLYQMLQSAISRKDSESSSSDRIIWLHFGVNSGATRIAIEHQAVNEATFRCPDEMGWKPQARHHFPFVNSILSVIFYFAVSLSYMLSDDRRSSSYYVQKVPIIPADGGISRTRETSLPVREIVTALVKKGYEVIMSDDAGRFVCNYVYYQSLRFAEQNGIKSLFVHVPLFLTLDEATQMEFVASLLEVLASLS